MVKWSYFLLSFPRRDPWRIQNSTAMNKVIHKCVGWNLSSSISNAKNISFTANFRNVKYKVPNIAGITSYTKLIAHNLRDSRIPTHVSVRRLTKMLRLSLHVSKVYISISGSFSAQTIAIPLIHSPIPAFSETKYPRIAIIRCPIIICATDNIAND